MLTLIKSVMDLIMNLSILYINIFWLIMRHSRFYKTSIFLLSTFILQSIFSTSFASEYSQPGFYDVTHYTLKNGLTVILKPRNLAKNVSIRLKVNVGSYNFECGKKEIAHYLEHLLFTGTSKHTETELDHIIELHGASWNATSKSEETIYEIDIFSKYIDIGLATLHEIITDSQISDSNVYKSLNIINRESGGKPSALRNWLYKNKYIYSSVNAAMNSLFSNPPWKCDEIDQSTNIIRNDILDAYKNYYTPDNITLSVVGDFNIDTIKKHINKTFGLMRKAQKTSRYEIPIPEVNSKLDENIVFTGRFEPLIGTDSEIYQIYRTSNMHHKDRVVFDVLEGYFSNEMFNYLRVDKGVAYSPSASSGSYDKFGFFLLTTDSEIDDVETSIKLIDQVVDKFKNGALDEKGLQETKLKILLNEARGAETNATFSNYYVDNAFELKRHGRFVSYVNEIEKVSLSDIQRVSKKYFHAGNRVIAVSSPTMTYTQFYILLLIMLGVVSVLVWRIVLRVRRKKNSRAVM